MSSTFLFRIRRLARQNGLKFSLGHAWPPHSADALDRCGRAHYDHQITPRFSAGLEQQRHVDDGETAARSGRALQEANARLGHRRMHEPFKALQRFCVTQPPRSKPLAIDLSFDRDAWKRLL